MNRHSKLKKAGVATPAFSGWSLLVGCLLSFAIVCPLWADEVKIGYVDLATVFDGYDRTKESEKGLERKGEKKQQELRNRAAELSKLRESIELLSNEAREAKVEEIEEKSDQLQRLKTRSERKLLRERNELARDILRDIDRAVADYAKKNNFTLILDQRSVVYVQDAYDLTDQVLEALNARYAAKGKRARR